MRRKVLICLLVLGLGVGRASAQFGGGVYHPTKYHNALLRYFQPQQHLVQLQKTYIQVVSAYNLALKMSQNLQNMPARYPAQFSPWRNVTALNSYGNTSGWITGANSGQPHAVPTGYRPATTELGAYERDALFGIKEERT